MDINGIDGFTEEEIAAVGTLAGLEETHKKTWYFKWARRGKRSALNEAAPPSIQPVAGGASEKPASPVPEPAARASTSPVSPLDFAGVSAASGEKDNPRPAKVPKITARKDCVETINELTKTKEVLRGKIENVRDHRDKLLAFNSELKAMKEEVLSKKEEPQTVGNGIDLAMELSQYYQTPMVMPHHRQPYVLDPTARSFPLSNGPQAQLYSASNEMGSSSRVGPLGFDLNLFPEEYFAAAAMEQPQPSDEMMEAADRRARSADARRRRRGMMKIKNMRSACGIKLPADD